MSLRYNSGNSLFTMAITGLRSHYYYLMQGVDGSGLSLENIINPSEDANNSMYMNYNFSAYMASNFSKMDMDGDGVLSENDLTKYTAQMCTMGLTYNQLAQLCTQYGSTSSLYQTVLDNFNEIDANGDGRVTNAEIRGYGVEKEAEQVKEKYPKYDLKGMSIFHDTSSVTNQYETQSTQNS